MRVKPREEAADQYQQHQYQRSAEACISLPCWTEPCLWTAAVRLAPLPALGLGEYVFRYDSDKPAKSSRSTISTTNRPSSRCLSLDLNQHVPVVC